MKKLNYVQVGNEGPDTVLLHGLNESLRGYRDVMNTLDGNLRMLGIDLRGHGKSEWHLPYNLDSYSADVIELISEVMNPPVILVGHSLGGLISLQIVAERPDLVKALVLEDPPLWTGQLQVMKALPLYNMFNSARTMLMQHHKNNETEDQMHARVVEWRVAGPGSPLLKDAYGDGFAKRLAWELHQTDPRTLDPVLDGTLFSDLDPDLVLAEIDCPVLLVTGEERLGSTMREEDILRASSLINHCHLTRLAGFGHDIHTADPALFSETIGGFLESRHLLA